MAHVFTGWMAFESGKTFLLSLKLFQQVVLVQIAKLTLTEYLLGQESQTRAVGIGLKIWGQVKIQAILFAFIPAKIWVGLPPSPFSDGPVLPPPTYGQRRKLLRFINSKT